MKRRILILFTLVIFTLTAFSLTAAAADFTTDGSKTFYNAIGLKDFPETDRYSTYLESNNLLYYNGTSEDDSENNDYHVVVLKNFEDVDNIKVPDTITVAGITYNVTGIEEGAFAHSDKLETVNIGRNVNNIAEDAFDDCPNLKSITVSFENPNYFSEDGILYMNYQDKKKLVRCPAGKFDGLAGNDTYTLPADVTDVGDFAFDECANLLNINADANSDFSSADGVLYKNNGNRKTLIRCLISATQCTIAADVTEIIDGDGAFDGCVNFAKIGVEQGNTTFRAVNGVLYSDNLNRLVRCPPGYNNRAYEIPDTVTVVDDDAFDDCLNLESITVDDLNSHYADYDDVLYYKDQGNLKLFRCPPGIESFVLSAAATAIVDTIEAFADCIKLTAIRVVNNDEDSVFYSDNNVLYCKVGDNPENSYELVKYPPGKTDQTFTIPAKINNLFVKSIGIEAFANCQNLETLNFHESYDFSNAIFWKDTFINSQSLRWVTILYYNDDLVIPYSTFKYCKNLTLNGDRGGSVETYAKIHHIPFGDRVSGVTLDSNSVSLHVDADRTLIATVEPDTAANKAVTWESSDEAFATVDNSGNVTAIAPGSAVITVTTEDGGFTDQCNVTVTIGVTGVTLNKTKLDLEMNDTEPLIPTVAPANATNKAVSWTSDDDDIATVDNNGKVTAIAPGSAKITVTTEDGAKTAFCDVTVTAAVTGVTLNKTKLNLEMNDTETLIPTVAPANATNKAVSWASSDSTVATVDANGKVTAIAPGSARITVTTKDGAKTASCDVTVTAAVTGVTLNKAKLDLKINTTETLVPAIAPANATNQALAWVSDRPDIATVDDRGKVTAVKPGFATITVTTEDGGYTAICKITSRKTVTHFLDIPDNAWYKEYVYDLAELNILHGKTSEYFVPEGFTKRSEFTKILARASGEDCEAYNTESAFKDVPENHWAKKYINWAAAKGIAKGNGNGFAPDDNITRQEMAAMLQRYADYKKVTLPKTNPRVTFEDDGDIAGWARESVYAMEQAGIIHGEPGNIFAPTGNAKRSCAAKMVSLFLKI